MLRTWTCTLAAVLLAGLAGCGDRPSDQASEPNDPLHVLVGGTMRPVMEKLAADYAEATGAEVDIDSAGSGELLIRIDTQKSGDLYVCHDPFQDMLMRKGLGVEGWTLAVVRPVIVVPEGNPKEVRSVKDLAREGMRLVMTDATHSTTGWIIPVIFEKAGVKDAIEKNIVTRTRGGGAAANMVATGNADAAIVWNAVGHARQDKLDVVPVDPEYRALPGVDAVTSATGRTYDIGRINVTMALLECSDQKSQARDFARFVLDHRETFERFGFAPAPARTAQGRSLYIHCGAGLRMAMEEAVEAFEKTSGAEIQASYQGSGTLITTIRLKETGDLYMPGDVWYIDQLKPSGLVASVHDVAWLVPVIIVPKGNPKGVRTLADFAKPGVKVGLGNPEAAQIGRTCRQIFPKAGVDPAAVEKNVVYRSVTVNELGVKVQTGAVDAAIVWDAVAASFARDVEAIDIPPEHNIASRVGIAVLTCSQDKPLAKQFATFLGGPEGKTIFARHDYTVIEPK